VQMNGLLLFTTTIALAALAAIVHFYPQRDSKRLPPGPPRKIFGAAKAPALPPYKLFALLHKKFGRLTCVN